MAVTRQSGWRFALDRGGTFTDLVALSPAGKLLTHKVLSRDPNRAGDAAVRAIREVLAACPEHGTVVESVRLGTTVATNALLERRGEPTLLVTTQGFGDALRIGYQQRPDIFARAIELAPMLYSAVVEADERVSAEGEVLRDLDEAALVVALRAARGAGLDAVAIAFLHGFRHPTHEQRAAALARAEGFAEVVTSHEAAPLIGLVARGDTCVADAYLSPILLRYLRQFSAEIAAICGETAVQLMQSNGGLVSADALRGVNGVLSGPAGGVVGMSAVGRAAARRHLIGFDMGGTSTDVSLTSGDLPRRHTSEIDGVRLQATMMDIRTIAAGGGSILRHADGRLQVGPHSAGADPGPACYRRGGPATITDCNVVLGRIPVATFPHVFGADGQQPLDVAAARARLAEICAAANSAGTDYTVESLATAFLEICVARMANAIREAALQQGEETSRFALISFGGAGGQHACLVAEALDMREILLHPLAGVLSAYGIAQAGRRAVRRRTAEVPLDECGHRAASVWLTEVEIAVRRDLRDQGVDDDCLQTALTAQVRSMGSDTALEVPWQAADAMREAFLAAHERLYGFSPQAPSLVIAALTAEAIEHIELDALPHDATALVAGDAPSQAARAAETTARVWMGEQWQQVPLRLRSHLHPGDAVCGPLLLCEAGATNWIAPEWSGKVDTQGTLRLTRSAALRATDTAGASGVDPMRLEVFNALFMHIAEQMGAVLRHTASSVNIKERLDFSCAIFDATANLVANAPHMPVHLGSMGASVAAVLAAHGPDLQPGDAYLLNSPYAGGTHLPDMTVVSPVFDVSSGQLGFFTASRAHHADIGGITPGSMPPFSRHIDDEGILIAPTRILRAGQLDTAGITALLSSGRQPARNTAQNLADLRAQIAANTRGAAELERAIGRYGRPTVMAYMGHVQDNAERCLRRAIRQLHDGHFRYDFDDGSAIEVRVQVQRDDGTALIDFSGTSAQRDSNFNAPRAVTIAAVLYVFRTLIDEPIPLNAGCLRPLRIVIPAGSMLDPRYPAAVVAGNVETSQCIVDALYGALGLQAAAQGTMNNFTFGDARHQYYETIAGGAGAGPGHDGASGVQTHMTNSRLTDPEVLESRFPVLLREFSLRRGSGGAGYHRGGDGLLRHVEFRAPMTAAILSNHRRVAPFGLAGGGGGSVGVNRWLHADGRQELLQASAELAVQPGDALVIETPGGGGYGAVESERRTSS